MKLSERLALARREKQSFVRQFRQRLARSQRSGKTFVKTLEGASEPFLFGRNLEAYSHSLGVNLFEKIESKIILSQDKRPIVVSDIGCGRGDALRQIKKEYGAFVQTMGFDLVELEAQQDLDSIVVGDFEEMDLSAEYVGTSDIVISSHAAYYMADFFSNAYPKIHDMLRPDGDAFIYVRGVPGLPPPELSDGGSRSGVAQKLLHEQGTLHITKDMPRELACDDDFYLLE